MTQTPAPRSIVAVPRIDVAEATWRVRIMEEIENDGGTLDDRQVEVLNHAVSVIAADSSFRNARPAGVMPTEFGPSNGNGSSAKATVRYASEKQIVNLRRELPRRDVKTIATDTAAEMLARCDRDGTDPMDVVPMRLASDALGILFAAPFNARTAPPAVSTTAATQPAAMTRTDTPAVTAEGAYRNAAGDIYRVQASRETGRLYAKRLDPSSGKFDYVKGSIYTLSADMRMTVEEAAEWGRESARAAKEAGRPHGWCVYGHRLTRPESILKGIGPVCEGKI